MNIVTAKYRYHDISNEKYTVEVVLTDGIKMSVPMNTDNRHYRMILEWAAIDGNNITDPGE
tara:strand:- start:2231 stop:2413 length:183 start_codon:yes stop_codon:yes gene_type:complete